MKTFALKTKVQADGVILLPQRFKDIFNHKVEITLKDLQTKAQKQEILRYFENIVSKYSKIKEPELSAETIFLQRES